ncbi:MAG: hypothetical protein QM777_23090 [Pseudorhodoferax sp.]
MLVAQVGRGHQIAEVRAVAVPISVVDAAQQDAMVSVQRPQLVERGLEIQARSRQLFTGGVLQALPFEDQRAGIDDGRRTVDVVLPDCGQRQREDWPLALVDRPQVLVDVVRDLGRQSLRAQAVEHLLRVAQAVVGVKRTGKIQRRARETRVGCEDFAVAGDRGVELSRRTCATRIDEGHQRRVVLGHECELAQQAIRAEPVASIHRIQDGDREPLHALLGRLRQHRTLRVVEAVLRRLKRRRGGISARLLHLLLGALPQPVARGLLSDGRRQASGAKPRGHATSNEEKGRNHLGRLRKGGPRRRRGPHGAIADQANPPE